MANATQITVLNSASDTATVSTLDAFNSGTASMVVRNSTASLLNATVVGNVTAIVSGGTVTAVISGGTVTAVVTGTTIVSGIVNATITGTALVSGVVAIDQAAQGTSNLVIAGRTRSVTLSLSISTTTAYGPNQSIGGVMSFANAFGSTGAGVFQTVDINWKSAQAATLVFFPFASNPTNSTFTDHVAAALAAADAFAVRDPVTLSTPVSNLGTHTNYAAYGIGAAMAPGTATLYGVLVATSTTNALNSTGDIQIVVKTLSDG